MRYLVIILIIIFLVVGLIEISVVKGGNVRYSESRWDVL